MKRTARRTALVITALASAATASCDRDPKADVPGSGAAESDPVTDSMPATPPDDDDVESAIVREIVVDGSVSIADVHASVTDGIATLTGTVDNIMAKERAVRLAQMVKGVRAVIDRVELDVSGFPEGGELADDVETALVFDPAADASEVEVTAKGHHVTLAGMVDSYQERWLTENVAQNVAGVAEVDNQLDVDWPEDRVDVEIQRDVESRLKWDVLIDDGLIDVAVSGGEVTLSGTVGSAIEKSRAIGDAWVMGVEKVTADDLEVARWARHDDLRGDKYTANVTNASIADAIEDAMSYDPRVNVFDVDVAVQTGVVTLSGKASSQRAREAAAQIARNTVGVLTVVNHVEVEPPKAVPDETLHDRAMAALALDPAVEGYEIDVTVEDGNVTLNGDVGSQFEKAQAEHVVAGLVGTNHVDNDLAVTTPSSAFVYDAYLGPYYPHVHTRLPLPPAIPKPDRELLEDVSHELFWSPFVDQEDVTVVVDDGRVTLLGTVDSWREYQAAAENVLDAGALSVENRLQVR